MSDQQFTFNKCVEDVLSSWTALELAVNNRAGGSDTVAKANWFCGATVNWFQENECLEVWEVADYLLDIMNTEFNTIVEDGSAEEIASDLCTFANLCQCGNNAAIGEKLKSIRKTDLSTVRVVEDEEIVGFSSENNDGAPQEMKSNTDNVESMETDNVNQDNAHQNVEVDDDGFIKVKSRSNRKR